jgi:Pup amidohydrolase
VSKIFERLIGLETEYAVRFRPRAGCQRPSDHDLYLRLTALLARKLPTAAPAKGYTLKQGLFLASGGAVWFEHTRLSTAIGLVEGSSPECRSPRQCIIGQRAQDRLLSETARQAAADGEFCLIKNCRDSRGEVYGAQENYEVVLARGWRLAAWRMAWLLLCPLLVVYLVFLGAWLVASVLTLLLFNLVLARLAYWMIVLTMRPDRAQRQEWLGRLFGRQWVTGSDQDEPCPPWVERLVLRLLQLGAAPVMLVMSGLVAVTNMRQTQARLLAFLASRAVLGGSGWLDAQGRFHLSEKAQTRRVVWLDVLADSSRPVFNLSHFLKIIAHLPWRFRELLAPRQRKQISLGDSNLCEEAEYLRVATTALVLDAIEAGAIVAPPRLRRPLAAIRQISRDPTLSTAVALEDGRRLTALEIQRWYLNACRRFVDRTASAPQEARDLVQRWQDVLDRLEGNRASLIGRLDWVTKKFLLDQAGQSLPWAARKKIDLRYHELSTAGYYSKLRAAGRTASVLTEAEIDAAMRLPPSSSPALQRVRYIREFSGDSTLLRVSWRFLEVIQEGGKRVIDLHKPLA